MIQLQNVSKKFSKKILFDDFNLNIDDGEFIVFHGNSGCGKTTLLNMLGGLEKPDNGSIIIDEIDITHEKNLRHYYTYKVGFLFQNFALLENKTVKQNLNLIQKKARNNISIENVLSSVGLLDKIDTKVYKLSGGEQQRVALARLMLKKCDIILADEPTGSLDSRNADIVMNILHKLNENGKTIILVTHNENYIKTAERVVELK